MFKILIAEDDRELRQLFQHVLTKKVMPQSAYRTARRRSPPWTQAITI